MGSPEPLILPVAVLIVMRDAKMPSQHKQNDINSAVLLHLEGKV